MSSHAHRHGHHHHGHDGHHRHHDHGAGDERRVFWAALLTGGFTLVEAAGGLLAGSLALLADAAHMLADAVALGLAWLAFRVARRPADLRRTYGFGRLQVLAAFANGVVLFVLAAWIMAEAAARLASPGEVLGGPMLAVAAAGLLVNLAAFAILHGGDRASLNLRGAVLHVLGDLLGSAAAIVAALVVLATGWTPVDPLLSVLVGLLVLRSAWRLVAESGHILLEGAPAGLDVGAIGPDLVAHVPGVAEVHHVHAWSLTEKRPLVTLHARMEGPPHDGGGEGRTRAAVKARLRERFGIGHATVEIERHDDADCGDGRGC
jgi:cobalt-zinc-cadmium efflux system protein